MEWRCEWCGKPHEENDPPCDNCGHGEFEKAVVPMAPEGEEGDDETITVWVCTECGNDHPKHTPPCDRCGGGPLERREVAYDEEAVMSEMLSEGRSVPSADVSYFDVLDTKLVLGFVGVGALVVFLALGFLGYVQIPGISPAPAVPGNATSVDGYDLSTAERAYLDELNTRRSENGFAELAADDNLGEAATYYNQQRVLADYTDSDGSDDDGVRSRLSDECGDTVQIVQFMVESDLGQGGGSQYDSATDIGASVVSAYFEQPATDHQHVTADANIVGVDIHVAPDGTIYVAQLVC